MRLTDVLRREAELTGKVGERHPKLVDLRNEKEELERRLLAAGAEHLPRFAARSRS